MTLATDNLGEAEAPRLPLQTFSQFLREHHLEAVAAEAARLGLASSERPIVAEVDRFLARLAAGQEAEIGASLIHQQAMLAYLDRFSREPDTLLAIARDLAAHVGALGGAAPAATFASLAHDLRSPLNALSGALSVLEAAPEGEARGRMLAIAKRNTDRLAELIDDWLVASRSS